MCLGNRTPNQIFNPNHREKCIGAWNSRGLSNKKEALQIFIKDEKPLCLCISETKLKNDSKFEIKNYTFIHKPQILQEGEINKKIKKL